MIIQLLILLAAYLLGSISGGVVLGRLRGVDIRTLGSGNAGGTNALRTQGAVFALGVLVIDIGKGIAATALLPRLAPGADASGDLALAAACGVAAIVGHIYPVFHGFRGGKGAATFVGSAAVLLPLAVAPILLIWSLVILISGYVGLATMIAALCLIPLCMLLAAAEQWPVLLPYAVAGSALIVHAHRGNIQRLFAGNENRFEKARFRHWFR